MTKPILGLLSFLVAIVLLVSLRGQNNTTVEAAELKRLLETATAQIEVAQSGQIVHVSEVQYDRGPPDYLEPSDPYHLPYATIWPAEAFVDRWIEIGEDGIITRWRTQVHNDEGELLQDLLFVNGIELNYFPKEGLAYRFEQESNRYRDSRLALIEDFLEREALFRRINSTFDGRSVLSVYTEPETFENTLWKAEDSLLYFNRPFIADLEPVSRAIRIDFDQQTFQPIGHGTIVWDQEGQEHVATYYTLVEHRMLPYTQGEFMFHLEIPEAAFEPSFHTAPGTRWINDLPQIVVHVDHSVYGVPATSSEFQLKSASLIIPGVYDQRPTTPGDLFSQGVGIEITYTANESTIVVIQGPTDEMINALRQIYPTWTIAEQIEVQLGKKPVSAWLLRTVDFTNLSYVVEAEDTLLYIKGQEIHHELILEFLDALVPLG